MKTLGRPRKALGDLSGPSTKAVFKHAARTKYETVSCHACGHTYKSRASIQRQNRKRGIKPICRDCFKKHEKELDQAIANLNKRKRTLHAPARKLHEKARMLEAEKCRKT